MMTAGQFLEAFFAASTGSIFVCSLPNDRDAASNGEAKLVGRGDFSRIDAFAKKCDIAGRGLFFAVNALIPGETRRSKDAIGEITCLHADIDLDKIDATRDEVERKLGQLLLLPSYVVSSGHGYHCYWVLTEAAEATAERIAEVEQLLRRLADHIGGDPAVCEVARLMRLPGSHNTKGGGWVEARIIAERPHRYDLADLAEWLADAGLFIRRKDRPGSGNSNPFLNTHIPGGGGAPVDVEARLAAMHHKGGGDASVHHTQLAVTAALLNRGCAIDEVVSTVLSATRTAASDDGARWKWDREERDIRAMCTTWQRKKLNGAQQQPQPQPPPAGRAGFSMAELAAREHDPVKFLVPGFIPAEGVTLLVAKPKVGKSWLLYDLCISATVGRDMLGDRRPLQGHALYLALEDGERRLKSRGEKLLPVWACPWPETLRLEMEWPRVDQGGLDRIRGWVAGVRDAGAPVACIAVDVLKMVRPAGQDRKAAYDRDYEALTGLRSLAHELSIALVVAHHTRKAEADDAIDKISGTHGLAGAADTLIVVERATDGKFVFDVRGRDVEAAQLAADFDRETCRWTIIGDAAEVQRSGAHSAILAALAEAESLSPAEIAAATGLGPNSMGPTLYRMCKAGEVSKTGRGRYRAGP
jgi:hypothetical protein